MYVQFSDPYLSLYNTIYTYIYCTLVYRKYTDRWCLIYDVFVIPNFLVIEWTNFSRKVSRYTHTIVIYLFIKIRVCFQRSNKQIRSIHTYSYDVYSNDENFIIYLFIYSLFLDLFLVCTYKFSYPELIVF